MTSETLALLAGLALSLAFQYIPHLNEWYEAREKTEKAAIMGLAIIAVGLGDFAFSCAGWIQIGISCDWSGMGELVKLILYALASNQGGYTLLVKPFQRQTDVPERL